MVFYRVEPLGCTNGLARIQKKHKNDQARETKNTIREEAAWRYKLLILLGLVTLFTILKMFTLPILLPLLTLLITLLILFKQLWEKRLLCLCKIWQNCFLGLGAKIGSEVGDPL